MGSSVCSYTPLNKNTEPRTPLGFSLLIIWAEMGGRGCLCMCMTAIFLPSGYRISLIPSVNRGNEKDYNIEESLGPKNKRRFFFLHLLHQNAVKHSSLLFNFSCCLCVLFSHLNWSFLEEERNLGKHMGLSVVLLLTWWWCSTRYIFIRMDGWKRNASATCIC